MNFEELSAEEHQKLLNAEGTYGAFFKNAADASMLLSRIMLHPLTDCDLFMRFLSQMTKHHTLSLLSLVRLHRIQAKMDLRYFLESTVHAAYSLVHTNAKNYFNFESGESPDPQKAARLAYHWVESAYGQHSNAIKRIKDDINAQTAHANIVNSQHNFSYFPGEQAEIQLSYFDLEDNDWVITDLWQCAHAGLIACDLLLAVQRQCGGFVPSHETDGLGQLIATNDALFDALAEKQNPHQRTRK